MRECAIAFDFDGTLVGSGSDKGVHIMYAAYAACAATELRCFLHPDDPGGDVERLLRALLRYPGAPRFQQLAACVNSLVHDRPVAVDAPGGLGLTARLAEGYARLRQAYDATYTALNDAAAAKYWAAYPDALLTLPRLAADFDLYIASGVPQELLHADLLRHGYDPGCFQAVWGADRQGGDDKAELLRRIRSRGYRDVLFVGDATRDLEYAREAGVKFFRIAGSGDFLRLAVLVRGGFPDQAEPWDWTEAEVALLRAKTRHLVVQLIAGRPLSPAEAVDVLHA